VRREVEAAGFKFDSESSILANPADPRTAKVFDQTIRGHTDQFILKFRKPGVENAGRRRAGLGNERAVSAFPHRRAQPLPGRPS
jgi:hypothetical protein